MKGRVCTSLKVGDKVTQETVDILWSDSKIFMALAGTLR